MGKEFLQVRTFEGFVKSVETDLGTAGGGKPKIHVRTITATHNFPDSSGHGFRPTSKRTNKDKEKTVAKLLCIYENNGHAVHLFKVLTRKQINKGRPPFTENEELRFIATTDKQASKLKKIFKKRVEVKGSLDRMPKVVFEQTTKAMKLKKTKPYPLNKITRKR